VLHEVPQTPEDELTAEVMAASKEATKSEAAEGVPAEGKEQDA
jgi:hypothetical protein